jgi:hypothetical protein
MNMDGVRQLRGADVATICGIVKDAEWLPHMFSPAGDSLVFVRVPANVRDAHPFLNNEGLDGLDRIALPFDAVREAARALDQASIHFVFHTALCGSTLLVKALEATGSPAALKEPAILLNLYYRAQRGNEQAQAKRLDVVLSLLARPFAGSEAIIVKAPCMVGPLIPQIMQLRPRSRAVLLRSDIRSFLLSVAKRGIRGRSWVRQVFANCRRAIPLEFGYDADETLQHTDLQIAGLAWLMRRWLFERISATLGRDRVLQISADEVYGSPEATLRTVTSLFGLGNSSDAIDAILRGPVFSQHSKESGRRFNSAEREGELIELSEVHQEEVEIALKWLAAVAEQRGIPVD